MKTIETLDKTIERMKWENGRLEIEVAHLKAENARYREALGLIASPVRSDGTYNRDRKACEELAREVLKGKL
jgi:predicted RNase H-like nuclease (RuvC/YqgF family)